MTVTPLQIPAMRGTLGDWIYYVTLLPLKEVCERVKKTDEIHSSTLLRELIQRALTPRSKEIAQYLRSQKQRFFNAVVLGVYGGEPEWHRIKLTKSDLFDPASLDNRVAESLGVLVLRGDEKLFAIDGQHRVEGIKEFIKEIEGSKLHSLEDEIVSIFVAHNNDGKGLQRTRRLFSTLNRYAKPVSLTEIIALDEDDIIAIVCRDLLETHFLFKKGRVSLEKRKSIASHDNKSFTSLVALYQTMDIYLMEGKRSEWRNFKTIRPRSDQTISAFIKRSHDFWDSLVKVLPELGKIKSLKDNEPLPSAYRGTHGGDSLFRPITPPMIAACLRRAEDFGMKQPIFIKRFSALPRWLNKPPWLGVLWDGANMIVREKNQELARKLILWMVNCDPNETKIKSSKLRQELGIVLNKQPEDVTLPKKVAN